MSYTLSYYRPVVRTTIKHPPWWRFWERSKLVHEKQLERVVVYDVSQRTADLLMADAEVILDFVPDASQVQLEQGQQPTSYIQTTSHRNYAVCDGYLEEWTK